MIPLLVALSPVAIYIPDLFMSGNVIFQIFMFHSEFLSFLFLFSLIVLRITTKKPMVSRKYTSYILLLAISLTLLSIVGIFITSSTSPNYIFSITRLRLEILSYMATSSIVIWIMQKDNIFFKKNFELIIIISPLIFLGYCTLLFFLPYEYFNEVVKEDSVIEYSQCATLVIGGIISMLISIRKNVSAIYRLIFILGGVLLLFIAGDEISWGQRILNAQTPEAFSNINAQNEITIHNLNTFHGYIPIGYILIGFWGSIAAFFINSLKLFSEKFRQLLVPKRYFFLIFFIPFLFNYYTYTNDHFIGRYTEPIELMLYSGITLFLTSIFVDKKR